MISIKEIFQRRKPKGKSVRGIITDSLRYVSWPLTILLYYLNLSANQVTLLGTLFILLPAYFYSLGGRTNAIIASILFIVWFIFDLADGEVARCREESSLKGVYLDCLYHDISMPILFFSLGIYSYKFFNNIYIIYIGFFVGLFGYATNLLRLDKYKTAAMFGKLIVKNKQSKNRYTRKAKLDKVIFFVINLFNHPQKMMFYFLILSLLNLIQYVIFFYFFFNACILIMKFIIEYGSGLKEFGLD